MGDESPIDTNDLRKSMGMSLSVSKMVFERGMVSLGCCYFLPLPPPLPNSSVMASG